MALRVKFSDVTAIIETDIVDIEPFIIVANQLVTEKLADKGLGSARLIEIERWLSAHFVAMREDSARMRKIERGETSVTFLDEVGEGLSSTRFGQTAQLLDTSGTLNKLSKPTAGLRVVAAPSVA